MKEKIKFVLTFAKPHKWKFAWEKIQDDLLWEALKMAGLYDFVSGLENGLDTMVGSGGLDFSGGQRQRIAIARAFVKNSPIMIFDESTSALDSHSENEILKTIRLLSGSKTIITIAHRLSTVLISDRVALMEDGKIAAIESPSHMFQGNGKFNVLFENQLNNVNFGG